ncbi:tRNA pseudouridine(55) synthase TruB [Eubacteriales bacterium OttesenSCG-928-A19]|nr:tRNA pseudouridine(55) synthase TruB [Eubacteriales bacterium OttesenSCG-928-A19]
MNGFLNLLKPPGMTSSDAVVCVRRTLSGEKVGHAGTLDPEAAGVLPIMIGKAARLFDVLTEKEKAYVAEIAFGIATDTQDAQGSALSGTGDVPTEGALRAVLPRFVGDIIQTPPAFSALKVGGKAAYRLAREGNAPVLTARPARVDGLTLLEMRPPDGALLRVDCGKGVYVRTLCHDIGQALGCGAHMRFLLRVRAGSFDIDRSVTLEEWMDAPDRAALLTPMDGPLSHLPMARVPASWADACRNGRPLASFEAIDPAATQGSPVRVYCGDRFAGLARWRDDALRFQAMLLE